jgi:hypothetical protein
VLKISRPVFQILTRYVIYVTAPDAGSYDSYSELLFGVNKVTDNQNVGLPRLWVSYPWVGSEERDFRYLIPQLQNANVEAVYDSFQLMPDSRLWPRIMQRLLSIGFNGWMYILTHQCCTRKAYTDELTSAIDQTLLHLGPSFPMIGLMYGIGNNLVPPNLRILPCISLGDPDWKNQVSKALKKDMSQGQHGKPREKRFVWELHPCFDGNPSLTAIEVHSRGQAIKFWRFAVPKSVSLVRWGQGPAGGKSISRNRLDEACGAGKYANCDINWFGASDVVSNTESAYAVFSGSLPEFICFGPAQAPSGPPAQMEILWPGLMKQ